MIILTDWPKTKYLEAHYRGLDTERLLRLKENMFHTMMTCVSEEAGGYAIHYEADGVDKELKIRKELK